MLRDGGNKTIRLKLAINKVNVSQHGIFLVSQSERLQSFSSISIVYIQYDDSVKGFDNLLRSHVAVAGATSLGGKFP